jgi:hypothetical protein
LANTEVHPQNMSDEGERPDEGDGDAAAGGEAKPAKNRSAQPEAAQQESQRGVLWHGNNRRGTLHKGHAVRVPPEQPKEPEEGGATHPRRHDP